MRHKMPIRRKTEQFSTELGVSSHIIYIKVFFQKNMQEQKHIEIRTSAVSKKQVNANIDIYTDILTI